MAKFRKTATRSLARLQTYFREFRRKVKHRAGLNNDPITVDAYWGYGREDYLFLKGRVLEDPPVEIKDTDGSWRNLVNAYRRFESDEVANAQVEVEFLGEYFKTQTDRGGYFVIDTILKKPTAKPKFPLTKAKIRVHSIPLRPNIEVMEEAFVMIPKDTAEYGVISDIDDTVLKSYVTSPLMAKTAYHTFFKRPQSRMSFAGAPELYQAFRRGSNENSRNPIFYVSNSPYNLFDFLIAFLETVKLPLGPVMLRDVGLFKERPDGQKSEKYESIAHILRTYTKLPFILIGDSGEKDADIYQDIARDFPNRIKAIYIRDVQSKRRAKRIKVLIENFKDVTMILANDSAEIEKHALSKGFIQQQTLEKMKEKLS